MSDAAKKKCARCKRKKLLDDFYAHGTAKDGRQAYCKTCGNARERPSKDPKVKAKALELHALGEPLSFDQIAAVLKLSVMRVQQLERTALAKCRRRATQLKLSIGSEAPGFVYTDTVD